MGLMSWWRERRAAQKLLAADLALNRDQKVIGEQVPELLGMDDVEGMAHVLDAIREWNTYATPDQALRLSTLLQESQEAFKADGRTMPYWGNLWVLRNYQRDLGIAAPEVARARGLDAESAGDRDGAQGV